VLREAALESCPRETAVDAVRVVLEKVRRDNGAGYGETDISAAALAREARRQCEKWLTPSLRPVVNATGVVIHTNLGRAPLDPRLFDEAKAVACGYCDLEYDLAEGRRGERYHHAAAALRRLLGCEEVLVVNNNAAAVFLVLNTFAKGREAVVSRGELVEIGGSFRIPEVMAASGARMKEVGTTNRTHLRDYADAVGEETALLMKVHRSNYRIEGFTAEVPMREISRLARERGLVDYYDLGSAHMGDLPWDLQRREPPLPEILQRHAPSLVSFSGDKLFGGVQAGIVAGKKALIDRLKRNQALRMLRVDKLTLALIERTALAYLRGENDRIPALALLRTPVETLRERAVNLAARMPLETEVTEGEGLVGGGTLPGATVPTVLLRIEGDAESLARHFRAHRVIGRIEGGRFLLDMRTLFPEDADAIVRAAAAWAK